MPNNAGFLTVKEVASRLGIGHLEARMLVENNEIPAEIAPGAGFLVSEQALAAYIQRTQSYTEFRIMNPGAVLYLPRKLDALPAGCYVLLHVEEATAQLCLAGEDDAGDVCTTDRLFTTNVYNVNAAFRPLGVTVELQT